MPLTTKQLISNYVPYAYQLYVNRLRRFLGDTAELNILSGEEESTDNFLYDCIIDALEEINYDFEPNTSWTITTVPSWTVVKLGATLHVLVGKGILSARNTLSYSDAGGVTVQDFDLYGRYIGFYNLLLNKYMRIVQSIKVGYNLDNCYGGVASEYGDLGTT